MSTTAKQLIGAYVDEYKRTFPSEWSGFLRSNADKLRASNDDFGEVMGSDLVERKLFEMPETLYTILTLRLSKDDMDWFRTKEGSRWFAKAYPQFRTSTRT